MEKPKMCGLGTDIDCRISIRLNRLLAHFSLWWCARCSNRTIKYVQTGFITGIGIISYFFLDISFENILWNGNCYRNLKSATEKLYKMRNKLVCWGNILLVLVDCGCWGSFDSKNFKVSIFVAVDKNRYIFNARK